MLLCKVLIVNESRFMGDIFSEILLEEPDFRVVGCATLLGDAIKILQECHLDVVLVSHQLPERGALQLTRLAKDIAPEVRVLVVGLSDNKYQVLPYVEAGAAGYILQDSSVDEMLETVRLARRKEAQISSDVAGELLKRLSKMTKLFTKVDGKFEDYQLTRREVQVLGFIGQGFTNREIASQLVLEVGTVKNHVHNILKKLNVTTREEAATYLGYMKR